MAVRSSTRINRSNRIRSGAMTPNTYLSQWSLSSPLLNQSEASVIPPGLAKMLLHCSTRNIGTTQMSKSAMLTTPYTIIVSPGSTIIVDDNRNLNHYLHQCPGNELLRHLHSQPLASVSRGIPMNLIRRLEENLPHRCMSIKAKVLLLTRRKSVLLQRERQLDRSSSQREHPYD
jgi:hypothetical protein